MKYQMTRESFAVNHAARRRWKSLFTALGFDYTACFTGRVLPNGDTFVPDFVLFHTHFQHLADEEPAAPGVALMTSSYHGKLQAASPVVAAPRPRKEYFEVVYVAVVTNLTVDLAVKLEHFGATHPLLVLGALPGYRNGGSGFSEDVKEGYKKLHGYGFVLLSQSFLGAPPSNNRRSFIIPGKDTDGTPGLFMASCFNEGARVHADIPGTIDAYRMARKSVA